MLSFDKVLFFTYFYGAPCKYLMCVCFLVRPMILRSKDILVSQLKDYIVAVLVIKLGALSKKLQPKNRLLMA